MNDRERLLHARRAYRRITVATDADVQALDDFMGESETRPLVRAGVSLQDSFYEDAVTELVGQTIRSELVAEPLPAARVELGRSALFGDDVSSPGDARFAVRGVLGEGSFGRVVLAYDRDIGREVAVKLFKNDPNATQGDVASEVQLTGRIDHPGVPPIYDVGMGDDGQVYLVMKRLEAMDLAEVISDLKAGDPATHKRYPFYQRGQLVVQLLRILVAAHARSILHRDIKPANLLVGLSGELMLIDWGVAIDLQAADGAGRICGTPSYMAPEQTTRSALDARTDLFAVGAVLYELMCLEMACPADEEMGALLKAIPRHRPRQMDRIHHPTQGCAPSEYLAVVNRALARNPADRFSSAAEMLQTLENVQAGIFNAICPRTTIKSRMHSLMRWLDYNPERNVSLLVVGLLSAMLGLVGVGLVVGHLLGSG